MSKMIRKTLTMGTLMLIIAALIVTAAIPAWADTAPPTAPSIHTLQGKVVSISGTSSLVVQNGNQPQITINVDGNTKYYLISIGQAQAYVNNTINQDNRLARKNGRPQPPVAKDLKRAHIPANWRDNFGWLDNFNPAAQFSDIQVGDRVIARTTNDANNLAKQILIIQAPVIQSVRGNISAVTANSITINPTTGNAVPLKIDDNTRIALKGLLLVQVNQYAVAVYNRNTSVAQTLNIQAAAPATPPAAHLTSITLTPSAVSGNLTIGSTLQFGAAGNYANGATADITSEVNWTSSDTGVATINNTGLARGVAEGTANITASQNGITSPAVALTVSSQP